MRLDWRHAATALALAALALFLAWRTIARDPAHPTAPAPPGANPQTETPPETPGGMEDRRPPASVAR